MSAEKIKAYRRKKALDVIMSIPSKKDLPPISDWLEGNLYNPPGSTPSPGMHRRTVAPHMIEPLECLHPDHPARWVSIMKSVQSTATYHGIGAIAYYISHQLGNIGFYTASQELSKSVSSGWIDPVIDRCGLSHCVKPISSRNARKRADSMYYKEFAGNLKMIINSYGSIASMKSTTLKFIVLDEVDEAGADIAGQGDPVQVIKGRTIALRDYKILEISTPTMLETSRINEGFSQGDQRRYFVPCPLCGEYQELRFSLDKDYGLTYEHEEIEGKFFVQPGTVRYICKLCKKGFGESHKQKMLEGGRWIAQAEPANKSHYSYHVSGLMSPAAFLSWERICEDHAETKQGRDLKAYKVFYNNDLGLPWAQVEAGANWSVFKSVAKDYSTGDSPPGALMLFGGIDVQKDRLELVIIGVGASLEWWLIEYEVFHGDTSHAETWDRLLGWLKNYDHVFMGKVMLAGVDTGYNPQGGSTLKTHFVYTQAGRSQGLLVPVRGSNSDKGRYVTRARVHGVAGVAARYDINTSAFKEVFFKSVIDRSVPFLRVNFPKYIRSPLGTGKKEADDHLYKSFCSERYQEIRKGVMAWKPIYQRNEILDCCIYAVAAVFIRGVDQVDTPEFWREYERSLVGEKTT